MLTLAQFNLPLLGAALLIGIATGWWMFRRRRPADAGRPTTHEPDDKAEP